MKIALYSAQAYDIKFFEEENENYNYELNFFKSHLDSKTADLAKDCDVVCAFVNDDLSREVLTRLHELGIKLIALRSAGFNNVDLVAASELGIEVVRVPSYSPNAVAEHAIALMLTLNRKTHKAYNRTRERNFSIDGLMGFDLAGKTVGIVGLGQIGAITANILKAFGCKVLVFDPHAKNISSEFTSVSLTQLFKESDIISLHCPLTPDTQHLIDSKAIGLMKESVMLINTSRGAVIETKAIIKGLKSGKIAYLGIDVYEEEADCFFEDLSETVMQDDILSRLLSFPNVLVTSHQAFFTKEAMHEIVNTTFMNIHDFANGVELINQIKAHSTPLCMK
jgi:D-lactate dehydrogenase